MTRILAIDPDFGAGGGGCACALLDCGLIIATWRERPTDPVNRAQHHLDRVVVEQPVYQGARSDRARTQDLLELAWCGAMLAGLYAGASGCEVDAPSPMRWKGTAPKPHQHYRMWALLTDDERLLLGGSATFAVITRAREKRSYSSSWQQADILDAAALGLWSVSRLPR